VSDLPDAAGPAVDASCVFVIFGGTGDLARRKILPALWELRRQNCISDRSVVLAVTRESMHDDVAYRALVREALSTAGADLDEAGPWVDGNVYFQSIEQGTHDDFRTLGARLAELEQRHGVPGNRVFYVALPPAAFAPTIEGLGSAGLDTSSGWTRLVIEKPFGRDLASATALNAVVHQWFDEAQVYRIDHYLGKETVQNLLVFRFANAVFESLWNRDHVDSVEITIAEDIGIEGRAGYYESAGLVRDILQNHGIQLLSLVAMGVPARMDAESIRAEKVRAVRSIVPVARTDVVFGQYARGRVRGEAVPAYREEHGVDPASNTETFAALRVRVENWRWQGVPFFLRAGKRLGRRLTEVVVNFRRPPVWMFEPMGGCEVQSNVLRLTIQPNEGFELLFDVKVPGEGMRLQRLPLDFFYKDRFSTLPEAYQTLLLDVVQGDQTLFVHSDEVDAAWRLFDPLLDGTMPVVPYEAGTWGPAEAQALLASAEHR
jgi:glucose-6-phosphate 1-dehydrogenase